MRIRLVGLALGAAICVPLATDPAHATDGDARRIIRGFEIAPVPLNLRGLDRNLVGLGSYLVNAAGGCNDCHTSPPYAPGHDPFAGEPKKVNAARYLAGGVPFGPTLVSANLTPDAKGRPAGLTLGQFVRTIRTGHDQQDGHLQQVMPWPVYQGLLLRDLTAIYTYLKAIPSRRSAPPPGP